MRRWLLVLAVLGFSAPARADWYEASSEHFVVYADDKERDVERFAEMLERYHSALAFLTGRDVPTPSPSNRVTIYAVGNDRDMSRLARSNDIAGFYIPRAGGSRAFVPNIRVSNGEPDFSLTVLMHEYAHHFFISSSRFAMPYWLSEGAAEFYASARFPKDGSIQLGRPAYHRAVELAYGDDIPVETLIQRGPDDEDTDSFYGRAWLLYHFLSFDAERQGQIAAYWRALATGTPSIEAGREAFGDLDALDRDLRQYLKQKRILSFNLPAEVVPIKPISVRRISEGFGAMMEVAIVSQRGVTREEAIELVPRARAIAARYPDDPDVLAALAEAELDAGNQDEALAAADAALAVNPASKHALVQKGLMLFRAAGDAADRDAAYQAAMAPFTALNKLENDHPLPLVFFYRSFTERGIEAPELARHALERAAELAPFDQTLWMNAALMEAREGQIAVAIDNLRPLAADPHGGEFAQHAGQLIALLKLSPEGEPIDVPALLAANRAGGTGDVASRAGDDPLPGEP